MAWFGRRDKPGEVEQTAREKRLSKKQARKVLDEKDAPPKRRLGRGAAMRNNEITVQQVPELPVVNTASATHIGTREYQQDAAYVCEPLEAGGLAFGILCDGMGGMDAGELVSAEVVEFMANRIAALTPASDIPAFYQQSIPEANAHILQNYAVDGQQPGTTLVSAIMVAGLGPGQLYWASVGDSRIYMLRGGEIAQMTRDHNYALQLQQLVDSGRMSQAEADANPQREALVSYIGAPVLELVDVSRGYFELEPGDIVLLCSDGLTKTLPDDVILQLVLENAGDLSEAARKLPLAAFDLSPGGQDNTSVILMQYNGPQGLENTEDAPIHTVRSEEEHESGEM